MIELGYKLNGIVHIGAHYGEEIPYYKTLVGNNIVCFEPLAHAFLAFKQSHPDIPIYQIALSDNNGSAKFYETADGAYGQMSSLLEPLDEIFHMTGGVKRTCTVHTMRFDTWFSLTCECYLCNCVVIDTQGSELQVLKGFGSLIHNFKFFSIECSEKPLYKGSATAQEVIDFMATNGFVQKTPTVSHGDILFVKF